MMPAKKKRKIDIDTSQKNLVIVESPAKAKTIKKYLGSGFEVVASMGHIRDLPKKDAIDLENDYAPSYEISADKKSIVTSLKKAAKQMEEVWIATDEDREGEAIGWHLCEAMSLDPSTTKRIVFREITKEAIQKAVKDPRTVDLNLVHAQQARRVLDRLVGFDLSPVLWKKVKTGLSAGRVQSVAVRLLVEREREIMNFEHDAFFKIKGQFLTGSEESLEAELHETIESEASTKEFLQGSIGATYTVTDVEQKPGSRSPSSPFTTSSLQQQASTRYGYPVARTMQIAQRLYEQGLITYMRTDSMNLSAQALKACEKEIKNRFGNDYHETRTYKSKKKGAQEAHEAIRPTDMGQDNAGADADQKKIYRLIRERTLASQMAKAKTLKTKAKIGLSTRSEWYVATGEVVSFPGFLAVLEHQKQENILPDLQVGAVLEPQEIVATQQFTKPPARYSEASLVKKLEELGIGRPSTYAPTINTIQKRGYVKKGISEGTATDFVRLMLIGSDITEDTINKKIGSTKGRLEPTDVGIVVTDFLNEYFANIMDYQFTADVEQEFDEIAHGGRIRHEMIDDFYQPFHKQVEDVTEHAERASGERILGEHPDNGKVVKVRVGRYGPLAQIGESDDEEVKFASLRGDVHLETITMEQALELFALPREVGERESKQIKASIGRFGPYVQWGSIFASLKEDDPYTIEYDRALELIKEKVEKEKAALLQTFEYKDKEGIVKMGRRGPFIKWNRKNIRLPKGVDGATVSQEDIETYIQEEVGKKKSAKKKKPAPKKKKPATKAKVTKKKPVKKK